MSRAWLWRLGTGAAAMDMSKSCISAATTHLPKAAIVFDHFHIIKRFNEKLSDLRRDLYREATQTMHRKVLKGARWRLHRVKYAIATPPIIHRQGKGKKCDSEYA